MRYGCVIVKDDGDCDNPPPRNVISIVTRSSWKPVFVIVMVVFTLKVVLLQTVMEQMFPAHM